MANNPSQKKRNRQNAVRQARNKAVRSEMRTRARRAIEAAESGDADATRKAMTAAQKRIDMAASKGVLHKRTAARRKSRLARRVNATLGD